MDNNNYKSESQVQRLANLYNINLDLFTWDKKDFVNYINKIIDENAQRSEAKRHKDDEVSYIDNIIKIKW